MTLKISKPLIASVFIYSLFLGTTELYAQKFFGGFGYSLFTDIVVSKPIINPEVENNERENRVGVNIISISLDMKYNVRQFNRNLALSLATSPCFGVGLAIEDFTFGNVRVPVYAQLDYGNLSTSKTNKDFGLGFGIGYEYDLYNLAGDADKFSFNTVALKLAFNFRDRHSFAFKIALPREVKMPYQDVIRVGNDYVKVDSYLRVTSYQLSYIRYWQF